MSDRSFEPNCCATCFDVTQVEDSSDPGAFQTHRPRKQKCLLHRHHRPTFGKTTVTTDLPSWRHIGWSGITLLGLYSFFVVHRHHRPPFVPAHRGVWDYIGNSPRVPGRMLESWCVPPLPFRKNSKFPKAVVSGGRGAAHTRTHP